MDAIARALRPVAGKLPLRTLLVFTSAIVLAAIAYAAIAFVRERADESREVVATFSSLEAQLNRLDALKWQVVAEQRVTPHVASETRRTRSEIAQAIAELRRMDNLHGHAEEIGQRYRAFSRAYEQEFRLIAAGSQAEAERLADERLSPSFDALEDPIHGERIEHAELADDHEMQARLGSAGTLLIAALVVALLFWRRDQAQLVLRRLTWQKESILNSAGEGIFGLGVDGRTTFANPAASRMTGHEVEELVGRDPHDLIHHTRADGSPYRRQDCPIFASLGDGTVHRSESDVYWRKDGTSFPVEYTSTPILEGGRVTGAVVVFKDITGRREVERTKDEFTSVVSHELRTPLTSIRASLGLLAGGMLGPLPEKGQRMVDIAVQNTDRLVRLINDILDIERINSGLIDMHVAPCDARELAVRATEAVSAVAADGGVTVVCDVEPAVLNADADRIIQTLTNLVSNAVKFSSPGDIVRVAGERRGDEIVFRVSDQGRGIPADKLESIFDRFQQVDASDSREKGGTGLGLAISRSIVDQHGGRIWAESVSGEGSTFTVALPAPVGDRTLPDRARGTGPTVLVCDDDPDVVEVVGAVLEQRGYRVIAARSGEQAIERARSEGPEAILLDLLMPGMSGWETAAVLQRDPTTREIPIVILSVLPADETEAPRAPVVDWVEKPLDEAALFAALDRAVAVKTGAFSVLVVENDPDVARVLTEAFARHGVKTRHAAGAAEAIECCERVPPDLLVLDLSSADAHRFEVVDWLRRHGHRTPLLVFSGGDLDDAERDRLLLGASMDILVTGGIAPKDFERHVVELLGRLTLERTEGDDELQAHPARR